MLVCPGTPFTITVLQNRVQGVPENMTHTDLFTSKMRPFKKTMLGLEDFIKFNKHQTNFSHICYD